MLAPLPALYLCDYFYIFNMNYLAQMLRDCSKNRSSSFTEISFPIIQEIENKIKNKNFNLRKKMRQRLIDRQKISKSDEKKDDMSTVSKKDSNNNKCEKEIINYIEAYDDQKNYQTKAAMVQLEDIRLDDKETENTFLICILMRKRKSIFKIEEVRRKLRNKENMKRMSLKQCDCCERVGKHKCLHTFCEGKCDKLRKSQKYDSVAAQDFEEQYEAIEVAQQLIEEKVKMGDLSLNVVRIIQKEEEAISIPKIDITEKEDQMKEEQQEEILNQRDRISENESKSEISESRRNRSSEQSKLKENSQEQKEPKQKEEQSKAELNEKQPQDMQQQIEDDLVQIQTIQRIPIHKDNNPPETQNKIANERFIFSLSTENFIYQMLQPNKTVLPIVDKNEDLAVPLKNEGRQVPEINKVQPSQGEQNGNFLDVLLSQLEDNIQSDKPDPQM